MCVSEDQERLRVDTVQRYGGKWCGFFSTFFVKNVFNTPADFYGIMWDVKGSWRV